MRYVMNNQTDATHNIAMDTWLLNDLKPDEPIFTLWQNRNAVILGQNQNTFQEVNQEYVDDHGIQVVRRVTGGGAVYHDLGNLNFTFIVPVEQTAEVNFHKFVQPMLAALHSLDIPAEITGRNDLVIDGKKISGNAQRYANSYLMHHGTLLFDTNVDTMVHALNVADEKFMSKAAKSVRSRVGMIKNYAPKETTMDSFFEALQYYLSNQGKDQEIILDSAQNAQITDLQKRQFSTWDWNYGKSPAFNFHSHEKFTGGAVDVFAQVEEGIIRDIHFEGDFLGLLDITPLRQKLIGQKFDEANIKRVLDEMDASDNYFGHIPNHDIAKMFAS